MPILPTDIVWCLSTSQGSQGFSRAAGLPGTNLGKYISTTPIVNSSVNNLFNDVDGNENVTSQSLYQCIFIYNTNSNLTLMSAVAWVTNKVAGGTTITIAKDIIGPISVNSSAAQADQIPIPSVAPIRVGTFSTPLTKSVGVLLGDIGPQQCAALWVQRKSNNTVAMNSDGVSLRVEGGTAS